MSDANFSRIDLFRQIKEEIRGSRDYLIVGIDIAKEKHHAFFGDANGHAVLKKLVFDNNQQGFERLIAHTEEKKARLSLEKVVFGLEPTANYHKSLAEYLVRRGDALVMVSANATVKNRELLDGRWDKNDMKDSANVADLIAQGKCLYYDHATHSIRELRSLLSLKRKLKKVEHSTRMRIRNHLIPQFFPELDAYFTSYTEGCLAIIKHCFAPREIAQRTFTAFVSLVTSRPPTPSQGAKLKAIWESAFHSVGCEMTRGVTFEASLLVDRLRQTMADSAAVDREIKRTCQSFKEYDAVMSIPGFGPAITAITIAAIGDPFRFQNTRQVLKMAGLDLSAHRSGKTSAAQSPKISKKGKAELRYGLYQAAMIASSKNLKFMAYFTGLIKDRHKEKGIKTRMRVKLAAKMLVIAWTLMKKKTAFDPSYLRINKD